MITPFSKIAMVPFASLLKKKKRLGKGERTALTALKGQERLRNIDLGEIQGQIDATNTTIRDATSSYNKAWGSFDTARKAFAETKSGKAMSGYYEKYKSYDPQAAKGYADEITKAMKSDSNWARKLQIDTGRSQIDEALKKINKSPNMFRAEIGEDDSVKFYGDQDVYNLMQSGQKFGDLQQDFATTLVEEAASKRYFSGYETQIADTMSEFQDQSALAFGGRNVRMAGPTEYQKFADKTSGYMKTMKEQKNIRETGIEKLGDKEEGTGLYGDLQKAQDTWAGNMTSYQTAYDEAKSNMGALTKRIKKYELLGLGKEQPRVNPNYKKPQMGYGAGYLRRSS